MTFPIGGAPFFDGRYAHNLTNSPGVNGLLESTNQFSDVVAMDAAAQQFGAFGAPPGFGGPGFGPMSFGGPPGGFGGGGFNPYTDPGLQYANSLQPLLSQASAAAHAPLTPNSGGGGESGGDKGIVSGLTSWIPIVGDITGGIHDVAKSIPIVGGILGSIF